MRIKEYEFRFSVIRWILSALPLWLAFADYFTLKAYVLKVYQPSAEYIDAGWLSWYLSLLTGALLAISLNLLLLRYKQKFGAQLASKTVAPIVMLVIILVNSYKYSSGFSGSHQIIFFYNPFLITLILTMFFHAALFFTQRNKTNRKLL